MYIFGRFGFGVSGSGGSGCSVVGAVLLPIGRCTVSGTLGDVADMIAGDDAVPVHEAGIVGATIDGGLISDHVQHDLHIHTRNDLTRQAR